ncbi:MAG TPA: methyltransferase [Methyloceanibacter sp.]|nr:methyltransferase [Methyloceanibacter sp.]
MSQSEPDAEARLRGQIEAYHETALAYACVKLGLPETMGSKAWTPEDLARRLDLSAPHLLRTLRGLVTIGLCEEQPGGSFTLTQSGHALAPDAHSTLREKLLIVVEQYSRPWANLAACVKTGTPAFDQTFGEPVGAWRRSHPEAGAVFEAYVEGETFAQAAPIVAALDLAGIKTAAEIGGGHGALLAAVLLAHPEVHGVLMDLPHKLAGARVYLQSDGLAGRVGLMGGDILEAVPAEADLYLLKSVLQQHGDDEARAILANCREAMKPGARLVVIERLLPERATDDPAAVMLDLHMMAITGGRARTKPEMEALLASAGLAPAAISLIDGGLSLIDTTRP